MPWKVAGERWHLGEKGFPPGRKVLWDRRVLQRLVEAIRQMEPGVEITWNNRDNIQVRVPGLSRIWAQIRTKDPQGLDCRFIIPKGTLNLSQVEGLGSTGIGSHRADADVLRMVLTDLTTAQTTRFQKAMKEMLSGLRSEGTPGETPAKKARTKPK